MISGERFQTIAEISLYSEMTDLITSQHLSMPQNLIKMSELAAENIAHYKIIYVYTHFLNEFFCKYYNFLQDDTILISHNSDLGIHQDMLKYLEGNKIKKWYCQNREISHPKLFSLPIGLANSQWPHGNQKLISEIKNKNNKKESLVYKNFDISTNLHARSACNNITSKNGIPLSPSVPISNYWEAMSKSVFVISPPGNGIDCHRIWEALFLRCIPIVKANIAFSQFLHLPILFVNSWEEVTIDFLKEQFKYYSTQTNLFDLPILEIDFWKKEITNNL